jgi:hypothetical protein
MWVRADGASKQEILLKGNAIRMPWSFSPDGSRIAYHVLGSATGFDLWTIPVHMSEHGPRLARRRFFFNPAHLKPSRRFLAYT